MPHFTRYLELDSLWHLSDFKSKSFSVLEFLASPFQSIHVSICLACFSIGNETEFYLFGIFFISFPEDTYMAFILICFVLVV